MRSWKRQVLLFILCLAGTPGPSNRPFSEAGQILGQHSGAALRLSGAASPPRPYSPGLGSRPGPAAVSSPLSRLQRTGTEASVKKLRIVAQRFHFTPSTIRVKPGTVLEIELRSQDTFHGFHILGTDINVEIPARGKGTVTVVFTPPAVGVYQFVCSVRCGAGHTEMTGRIAVKENDDEE